MKETIVKITEALALAKKNGYTIKLDARSRSYITIPIEDYAILIEELNLDPIKTEEIYFNGCEVIASIDEAE